MHCKPTASAGTALTLTILAASLSSSGVPTFIDGRADVFGDRFLRSYVTSLNLSAPGGLEQLLEQHSIRWTLLSPAHTSARGSRPAAGLARLQ